MVNENDIAGILKDYVLVNKDAWRPLIFQGKLVFNPNSVNRKRVVRAIMDMIKEKKNPKHIILPPKTVYRYLDCKHNHKNVDPPDIRTTASYCNLYLYKDDCKNCQDFKGKD